jgi:hypothetical protein
LDALGGIEEYRVGDCGMRGVDSLDIARHLITKGYEKS